MEKKEPKDDAIVYHEISKRDDGRLWIVNVTCSDALSEDEFAMACISLGQDILEGKVDWDTGETSDQH